MRYPASEKLEIIRTVDASHLPTRQTLRMLGIPNSTYYDWYARWSDGGFDALADRSPRPRSVWNRIPDKVREDVVEFALEHDDLAPRELAVKYTDEKRYFVSESSMYRFLSAEDLITAPAHVVIRAADEFRDKTTRPNELLLSADCFAIACRAKGRPTSPISRSSAGAGIYLSPRSWTITAATSSRGNSARR